MKIIIGITTSLNRSENITKQGIKHLEGVDLINVSSDYSDAINASNGIPLLIPILKDYDSERVKRIVECIDGLLITGGEDIHPQFYNEEVYKSKDNDLMTIDQERDTFELALLKEAILSKLPILGICRGHQLINVAFGGSLYQDISNLCESDINHLAPLDNKERLIHSVQIKEDSILMGIFNSSKIEVNSFHHQSIKRIADNFKIIASSQDNVIEAMKYNGSQWILGIQWHPEMLFRSDSKQRKIFEVFVDEIKKAKNNN